QARRRRGRRAPARAVAHRPRSTRALVRLRLHAGAPPVRGAPAVTRRLVRRPALEAAQYLSLQAFGRSPEPTTDVNAETDAVEKRHCSEIGRISSNTSSAS